MEDFTSEIKAAKRDKLYNTILSVILLMLIPLLILLTFVVPFLLIFDIPLIIAESKIIKKIKKRKSKIATMQVKQKEMEKYCVENGYEKICEDLYLNEKDKKVLLKGKEYGFSQIIDCKLSEDIYTEIIADRNSSTSYGIQDKMCRGITIDVTVEDFERPHVELIFSCYTNVISSQYQKIKQQAEQALSTLKIIISKNNEKYVEEGTVTKIEHKHITEKSVDELLEKLHELHKNGVLTDYEYSMKKAELLDKLK